MPFTLIKGTFHVKNLAPDGDTVRFKAKKTANWNKLLGRPAKRNARNEASLRFEGIDTLETHYTVAGSGQSHQPEELADAATDFNLNALGVRVQRWAANRSRVLEAMDGTPGYILSRTTERFQRPVAFVFAGSTSRADGSSVRLEPVGLRKSVNYKLVKSGMAYPTFYEGLFFDLRQELAAAAVDAFNRNVGVWPYDWSMGVPVGGLADLEDTYVVLPKLYRRLAGYLGSNNDSVQGFKAWLRTKNEKVLVISRGQMTKFDDVIEQRGNMVGLTVDPEDLMFFP